MSEFDTGCCVICGGRIIYCSWPPVCGAACREAWQVECAFNRMAKKEAEDIGRLKTENTKGVG